MDYRNDHLKEKVENAPALTGIYLMKDDHDKIIYVGKSKNLRTRIRAYFGGKDSRPMIPFLLSRINDVDFIVTETEKEALILENTLIKKHRPRYNVNFRDDKNYFSIRIDLKEPYPRFRLVRRMKKDGAKYFGPYSSSAAVKETLHFLQKIFPLRTCKDVEFRSRKRPCIEYEINRCLAPCLGCVGSEDYDSVVKDAVLFMEGQGKQLISGLKSRMKTAAKDMHFEEAARIRDRINAIETTMEKQRAVSPTFKDQDIFGLYRIDDQIQTCLLYVRGGSMVGKKTFPLCKSKAGSSDVLSSLLKQYYDSGAFIPREIIIPEHIEDGNVIEEWLSEKKAGEKVSVFVPQRGDKTKLLATACNNAENIYKTERLSHVEDENTLTILAERLRLRRVPHQIECFDISNVGGRYAVGSMVTFLNGRPHKSGYRRFKIKTVSGADDYAMLYEVLKRRYSRENNFPDLIIIDGGKGQLNVALSVLYELNISDIDVIGLAKETRTITGAATAIHKEEDRVYLPNRKNPLYLSRFPQALFLLQRVRDEAHRFAVSYYRKLKEKSDLRSWIDVVPGIGDFRKKALLRFFGDIERLRNASREELEQVPGIGRETADRIFTHFSNKETL
jgi:excinuclease ABC subunit C